MLNGRRRFLGTIGLGLIGAGGLILPKEALAFGRRRAPSCQPPCPRGSQDDVIFEFPCGANGPVALIGGGFFTWGYGLTGVAIQKVMLTQDQQLPTLGSDPTPYGTSDDITADPAGTLSASVFSKRHYGLTPDQDFSIFVRWTKNGHTYHALKGPYTAWKPY